MNEGLKDTSMFDKIKEIRATMLTENKITNKDINLCKEWKHLSDEALEALAMEGHDYHFIGKVSSFCPIKPGCGGGILLREKDGKYFAASGSKGRRWLEAETVHQLGKEADIDQSYYAAMCDKSVDAISKYADFEWFISDDPYVNGSRLNQNNNDYVPSNNLMKPIGDDEEDIPF